MHSTYFRAALLAACLPAARGEIKVFGSTLAATSGSVHYSTSYLVDPGSVDLSYLTFSIGNVEKESSLLPANDGEFDFTDDLIDDELEEEIEEIIEEEIEAIESGEFDDYYDGYFNSTDTNSTNDSYYEKGNDTDADSANDIYYENDNSTDANNTDDMYYEYDNSTDANTTDTEEDLLDEDTNTTESTENSTGAYDDFDFEELDMNDGEDFGDGGNRARQLGLLGFTVDVLFFHEPSDCAKTKDGCDWTELGVGASYSEDEAMWCCAQDSVELGLCGVSEIGRVIINKDKFRGEHRFVTMPSEGSYVGNLSYPLFTTNAGSGQYTLLLANCDDYGRDVQVEGETIWKSKGGFLPGDRFEEWHFIILLTLSYAALLVWYGYSMKKNQDSRIGIQNWIFVTISLGFLHCFFRNTDYVVWNMEGYRSDAATYTAITIGVVKGAISRCLLIMVSLGWGVVRDSLGDKMKRIVMLGLVYLFTAFCRDVSERVFVEEIHVLSVGEEVAIYDLFTVFTLVTAAIDVLCYLWILDSLNGTMQYLENMNQSTKLKQYLRLRLILLLSILFALFWTVLGVVDTTMETAVLTENQDWIIPAAWSINYFFLLISIAMLWRPNPRAKEFAYVMELPSSVGDDLDFESNIDTIGEGYDDDTTMLKVDKGVST